MTQAISWSRRSFLRRGAGACVVLVPGSRIVTRVEAFASPLRVAVYVDDGIDAVVAEQARAGAELGLAEASRAATLLGRAIELGGDVRARADAHALVAGREASVVVSATDASTTAELASAASAHGIVLLNVLSGADALRGERCARLAFHVAASDRMRADARARWDRQRTGTSAPSPGVELWDASLERYGAAQLNDRFRAQYRRSMDSAAWAAWMAVKAAWEAAQRLRAIDGPALAAYLARETTRFDGHKGVPLTFRPWDHQLRQPLYLVASDPNGGSPAARRVVGTVPAPGQERSLRDPLDELGTTAEATRCRWT